MPYVKTPWIALKEEDIKDVINDVSTEVNNMSELNAAYMCLRKKSNITNMVKGHLLRNTEIGKLGFYHTIHNNWKSLPSDVITEVGGEIVLSNSPPDYLLNYGCKYEDAFAKAATDPLDHLGFTVIGSFWRDTSLSNLHYTFAQIAENNSALFATLMLTGKGQHLLKDYAFATHPVAYISGGFMKLTLSDIFGVLEITIADLGSVDSIKQMLEILRSSIKVMNPLKAFHNSYLLKSEGVIGRDRKYIKTVLHRLIDQADFEEIGEYFHDFFMANVPETTQARVPQPPDLGAKRDVIEYIDKLVIEFSPLIAGVGEGLIKTVQALIGRLIRIFNRVLLISEKAPEEIIDLVIDIVHKITGIPSPMIAAAQHVHNMLPEKK